MNTTPRITDDTALQLLTFMEEQRKVIQQLVDGAEQLGEKVQNQSLEFVLCHSDIHAGNVSLADDGALYIVDWDQPIMVPKERDLMFIGGAVANIWNEFHEGKFFYEGYAEVEINRETVPYYRHERIVKDIAEYGKALLLTTEGGQECVEMYKRFRDMFEPNGVVEIALKMDE